MTEEEVLQKLDVFKNAIISLKDSLNKEKELNNNLQNQINELQNKDGDFVNQISNKLIEINTILED